MTEFDYDLFVTGAGSGGVRAARVAIAESYRPGGHLRHPRLRAEEAARLRG